MHSLKDTKERFERVRGTYLWKVCKNGSISMGNRRAGKRILATAGFSIRVSEDETSYHDSLSCENLWQLSYRLQWLPFSASISIVKFSCS